MTQGLGFGFGFTSSRIIVYLGSHLGSKLVKVRDTNRIKRGSNLLAICC